MLERSLTTYSQASFTLGWVLNKSCPQGNRSRMDLHFSFTAAQLTFISHPISNQLFCNSCLSPCPELCYINFHQLPKSTQKVVRNFPLLCFFFLAWTLGCSAQHYPPQILAVLLPLAIFERLQDECRNTHKMNAEGGQKAPSISMSGRNEPLLYMVSLSRLFPPTLFRFQLIPVYAHRVTARHSPHSLHATQRWHSAISLAD